ncbi:hypothetical protein [Paraburkholderia rhynchosiae]|uniref:hypothetical protein n=1 Tax=Paraburkholderia rhynchosiae TaxID=487049 RepID=UPI001FCA1D40|nr:hypothetical protein [Paraburkholderia rhynchosiae]
MRSNEDNALGVAAQALKQDGIGANQAGKARRKHKGEVVHLVAHHPEDLSEWLGDLATASRDFH